MRLQELIMESVNEDRAIISLSNTLYSLVQEYIPEEDDFPAFTDPYNEIIKIGKIGQLVDTPLELFNGITLELQSEEMMKNRNPDDPDAAYGIWNSDNQTIVLNLDLLSHRRIKTVIAHELRHALDDLKSNFKAGSSTRYSTPRNKEHRLNRNNDDTPYLAQPMEINARFVEVLDNLVPVIKNSVLSMPLEQAKANIMKAFRTKMEELQISQLFPEKEKSKQYKQLMKRAVEFMQKEIAYIQQSNA